MTRENGSYFHYKDMKKFFKKSSQKPSEFEIISQECCLVDALQKLSAKLWSVYNHGSGEWGPFALYGREEIL